MENTKQPDQDLFNHLESLKKENEALKKKVSRKEKWIEKDERLARKDRICRLVTANDLADKAFIKKYPNAQIGDEFNDPEPLLWKLGFKRPPTLEETHAQIAAQFARDFREFDEEKDSLLDQFEDEEEDFTHSEVQSFLYESALQDAHNASQATKQEALPPAKQSDNVASGGVATAEQTNQTSEGE